MSEDKGKDTVEAVALISKIKQTPNKELGITQEYNQKNRDKLWDSQKGKTEYKDKVFGDKQTYFDPISGKTLHKKQNAAQKKYHMKNADNKNISSKWAEHSAETDHINALKDVHDKAKYNPFLTDKDFKDVMNSDENYRILSKTDNAAKGEKNDWQIITEKDSGISPDGKVQMARQKFKSDITLSGKFGVKTGQNVGREFVSGATDTLVNSTIPLTAEAVIKLVSVAQGKESIGEATKDMGKTAANIAVAGGTNKLLVDVVSSQMANSSNVILKSISKSNGVAQIIAVATIVQKSAVKYINGEINGKEFVEEIGQKGSTMVAGMIGGEVGREIGGIVGGLIGTAAIPIPGVGTVAGYVTGEVIGQVLGVILTTISCGIIVSVYNTSKHLNDYKLKESQICRLESDALKEIEKQRCKFREIVEYEYKVWDETIQSGFDQILRSVCEETYNLQGITDGIDTILSLFGKKVKFSSIEEYEKQLDMPLKLSF